jgi:bifunctional NMN adenylyltransferase/nudix hydrolase
MENLLYIGRFQPFHNGHLRTLEYGLEHAYRVIVGLGSCNANLSAKNPWSAGDRENMIRYSLQFKHAHRVGIIHLYDYPESDQEWASRVRQQMDRFPGDWGIVGMRKDASSFYLDLFPDKEVLCPDPATTLVLDATTVRKKLYVPGTTNLDAVRDMIPRGTEEVLKHYITTEAFKQASKGSY